MANKTKASKASVGKFVQDIDSEEQRNDVQELVELLKDTTGEVPKMWGKMIGFGSYSYVNSTKKENTWFRSGLAPRKGKISLYLMPGYDHDKRQELLAKLGKYNLGKCCLTFKRLDDVDKEVLGKVIKSAWSKQVDS